jgi:hypothetical protein
MTTADAPVRTHPSPATTATEAERVYRAIFRGDPPPVVVSRFEEAFALLQENAPAGDVRAYRAALARVGDLEALEVAARYRRKLPLLSRAFRLMAYIAETVPGTQDHFVKRRPSRAAACAALIGGGLRTSGKMARGLVLLARVEHV